MKTWNALSAACVTSSLLRRTAHGFTSSSLQLHPSSTMSSSTSSLSAKPQRLQENVPGVVYVNDKCINCAACSGFAPATFARNSPETSSTAAHIVHRQPQTADEITHARQALAACPVAAIRVETLAEKRSRSSSAKTETEWTSDDQWLVDQMTGRPKAETEKEQASPAAALPLFPRPFLDSIPDVYWLGHHNSKSFGAVPYLLRVPDDINKNNKDDIWIMVDSPKFSKSSIQAVTSLTGPNGPDYFMLTHVDDTADHQKWADEFPNLQRIFHAGDLGRYNWLNDATLETVEVLLQPQATIGDKSSLTAYTLDGTPLPSDWQQNPSNTPRVVVLHTPGHSPGSISLYLRPADDTDTASSSSNKDQHQGILFTGDTYAFTPNGHRMTGFPRYGNHLQRQAETLQNLLELDWNVIAPGHGHARDYRHEESSLRVEEMQDAIQELRRW